MTAPDIFDRRLLRQRRLNALRKKVSGADFLMKTVSDDLADRLSMISRSFKTGIDLGGHTGHIADMLRQSGKVETVYRGDLFDPDPALTPPDFVFDDALPPLKEASVGLIVSALSLQFVNDLPGALIQIRRALEPDGLFLATLPGAETLFELRDVLMRAELELSGGAAPRVGPFTDVRELGSLLQRAGFALPVTDLDRITVRYNSLFDLMNDLRAMGAASVLQERSRTPVPKQVFFRAAELYARDHADADGRIRATFALVSLSGWAPHESQQKPLKPGSAKTSLADALKAQEDDLKE